jgi:phosphate acetyltransferase
VQTVTAGVGIKPVRYTNDAADSALPHPARTEEQYQRLIARTKRIRAIRMAVVWPCEEHALAGAADAVVADIVTPPSSAPR